MMTSSMVSHIIDDVLDHHIGLNKYAGYGVSVKRMGGQADDKSILLFQMYYLQESTEVAG
jgi:hypothetical protein